MKVSCTILYTPIFWLFKECYCYHLGRFYMGTHGDNADLNYQDGHYGKGRGNFPPWIFRPSAENALAGLGDGQRQVGLAICLHILQDLWKSLNLSYHSHLFALFRDCDCESAAEKKGFKRSRKLTQMKKVLTNVSIKPRRCSRIFFR